MDHKTFKRFQHVNTAANIAACGTCIAVFGLNPIAIGLSYIGTDILFSMIDAAIEKGFLEKWKRIEDPEDRKEKIKELREFMRESSPAECEQINQLMHKMGELKEKLEIEKKELKKKQEEADIAFSQIKNPNYNVVMNTIEMFISYYCDLKSGHKKKSLKELKLEFLKLKENIEKQPEVTASINRYFYLYTQEVINLMEKEENVKEENKEEYHEMLEKVKKEFLTYVSNLNVRIEDSSSQDIGISMNLLLTELQRINGSTDSEEEPKKSV